MSDRPPPHELYYQAVSSHGAQGTEAVRREYHRLLAAHGHLVPRPDCTCAHVVDHPDEHAPGCPRHRDNDRRLPCGLEPGSRTCPRPLTVVVTGGRNWAHARMLRNVLLGVALPYLLGDDQAAGCEILVGDCPTGADAQTRDVCERVGLPYRVFRARWDQMRAEGKPRDAAGPLRNRELLDALQAAEGERLVVAFHDGLPQSKGTRDCVNEALRRGLPVYHVSRLQGQRAMPR